MDQSVFDIFLITMSGIALIVFIALYFVEAGYGLMFDRKWGLPLDNRWAWMLMEAPVFLVMLAFWWSSDRKYETVPLLFFLFFECHYFQRSFIFPWLIKSRSRMPLGIMLMGICFNLLNGIMQGEWIFFLSPADRYDLAWLQTPQFIVGTLLFFTGMILNIQSDRIIRHLRAPGDTRHYLPEKGLFRYITSANYFGEIVEWCGFAIMTWSWAGAVFAWWTIANLVPRSNSIYHRYQQEFGAERLKGKKRILPFIY